uniref:Pleckstrin and Sec7 domain containing n=2 Tax=Cyprinodon variegatus TaxID=28743 RepID=A0A3Q2CE22_CYPVA
MGDGSGVQTDQRARPSTGPQQSSAYLSKRKDPGVKGATMSQPSKVLHLYVEVRSVSEGEEEFLGTGDNGANQLMLQCPDIVSHSQRSSSRSSSNRSSSPVTPYCSAGGNHSLASSQSSSRHSVSCQHPSPAQFHHQDDLNESFSHLLEILTPNKAIVNHYGSPGCTPDLDPCYGKVANPQSSSPPRWLSIPSTYSTSPRSRHAPAMLDENGQTSLVSYGYIENGSVNSMSGHGTVWHQHDADRYLRRTENQQKRMSDPVWYSDQTSGDTLQPKRDSSPSLSKATMEAVARDATHRALEEFGSPELRRRFAGHRSENNSPSQAPRCRSLGGSPVQSRSTRTLPSRRDLLEMDRRLCHGSLNRLPRSPASDRLSAQTGDSFYSSARPHGPPQSPQRPWVQGEGHRFNAFQAPLPAGRPTDIQHEIPRSSFPAGAEHHARNSYHGISNRCHDKTTNSGHCPWEAGSCSDQSDSKSSHPPRCSSRTSDANSPISDRRSISPYSITELDYKALGESNRTSADRWNKWTPSPTPSEADSLIAESPRYSGPSLKESHLRHLEPKLTENQNHSRRTETLAPQTKPGRISPMMSKKVPPPSASPAIPSQLDRISASGSPVLDPQLRRTPSPSKDVSSLHPYQPTRSSGNPGPSAMDQRQYDHLFDGPPAVSPVITKRSVSSQHSEVPLVSWTAREQKQSGPLVDRADTVSKASSRSPALSGDPCRRKDTRGVQKQLAQECQLLVLGMPKSQKEAQDPSGATGMSSSSSSGVTGSLSPETSSQSSHGTADGGSGIQLDGGSPSGPSSHSQKIARAKWEFLFGGPTDHSDRSKDASSTTPPTSCSPSPSPTSPLPLQPSNQRRCWELRDQKLSHHEVQQVEVELVTPHPQEPAPKTGIIRRSIKYSETDLDAVPLRCYRETDLDEVMRAEAEAAEEADSAFSSNRCLLGKSCFSPEDVCHQSNTGGRREQNGQEEEEDEDEDDEEEEEGVVSWASVRMQGDRQRQRVTQEEEEVFSLLLKRTLEPSSDAHGGLKSPISVDSPRRPSESNLDSFSRHFESIMESHRAKGTSYSSLDSVDLLTSGSTSVFTFDLPTLTPEIQSQICESAKQILELSFAPLARTDSLACSETSRSETALSASGDGLHGRSKDDSGPPVRSRSQKESWRCSIVKEGFRKASSVPALHSRERPGNRPPELLYPQADVAERLALGGSDEVLTNGLKPDLLAAKRLAKRLYNLDGFRKSDVARHLSKNNDFSQLVAQEYLSHFNFSGMNIEQALRKFLTHFALMGETQERERVLAHFSRRYRQCNPESPSTEDSVHTLTCAVMLLNTDLHGNNVGKRMSCSQFISNLEGLNDGKDFPKDLLKTLYSSIKNEKLQWTIDEEELRKSMSELADVRTDSASHTMKRIGSGGNPLVGVAHQADGELYKSGFLVRKVHADPDGKRTPRGKRSWKTFYAMLKGLVLYLQKDEYRTEQELTEEDVKNAVSVHHSLAMRAADYSKRPNVFYLRTADWRVFLFQAPNPEQMQSWITRINVVAAMFSAPPFPAAIGSQKRFSRPLLPGSNTKLSQEEQLKSHESRYRAVHSELTELLAATPDRKVKGRELEEQKLRKEYLEFEKTRYGTYAMLLRAKMAKGDDDLAAFEARLYSDGGLQRAHSSPTLPQDAASKEKARSGKTSKSLKVTSSSSSVMKSGVKEGGGGKSAGGNSQKAELQKQSSKQEEAA